MDKDAISFAATQAILEIIEDLRNRRGLSDVFDDIDDGVQEEILNTWTRIVADHIQQGVDTSNAL